MISRMGLLLLHSSSNALHVRRLKGEAARQRQLHAAGLMKWTWENMFNDPLNTNCSSHWQTNLISWYRIPVSRVISHKAELPLMEFICSRTGTRTTCETAPDHEARLGRLVSGPGHLKVLLWFENKNDTFVFFYSFHEATERIFFAAAHSVRCSVITQLFSPCCSLGPHLHWHNDWNVPVTVWSQLQPQPAYFPLDMVKPLSCHDDDDDDDAHRAAYFMPHTFSSGSDPDRMPSFSLLQPGSRGTHSMVLWENIDKFRGRRRRVRPLKHRVFLKGK